MLRDVVEHRFVILSAPVKSMKTNTDVTDARQSPNRMLFRRAACPPAAAQGGRRRDGDGDGDDRTAVTCDAMYINWTICARAAAARRR